MSNNVQEIKILGDGKANITITGETYAAFIQDVGVSYDNDGPRYDEYRGSGEGVTFNRNTTLTNVTLPITFAFSFTYSDDGGKTFSPAKRSQKKTEYETDVVQVYSVTSEDATDNDNDDTVMTLSVHRLS